MLNVLCMEIETLPESVLEDTHFLSYLEPKRQDRIRQCKNRVEKQRNFAAGLLLTYGLQRNFLLDTEQKEEFRKISGENILQSVLKEESPWKCGLSLTYSENGKPVLKEQKFNISHSGKLVMIVLSNKEIGIDLQIRKKMKEEVKNRIHHPREIHESMRDSIVYWTAKEAYVKYTGEGLKKDFRTLYVDFQQNRIVDESNGKTAELKSLQVQEGYECFLCAASFYNS